MDFHLVSPRIFDTLSFTEKLQVGTTALVIGAILIVVGFLLVRYAGIPLLSYQSGGELTASIIGITLIIGALWLLLSYINFLLFIGIVGFVGYGVLSEL